MATESTSKANNDDLKKPAYKLVSQPSEVIKSVAKTIEIDKVHLKLTLVAMKRSFLLVISNVGDDTVYQINPDDMVRGFSASNLPLQGLSLAIGKHSTTIIDSDNSLASASLATKLSEKLNLNRPVYVANNFQLPYNFVEPDSFMSKLYLKLFQFVKANYNAE